MAAVSEPQGIGVGRKGGVPRAAESRGGREESEAR